MAAGLLSGLCCTIEPQRAFTILWAVLTRQWLLAGAASAVVARFSARAVARYGFQSFVDYKQARHRPCA
jgi:hypothetical protein